MSRQLTPLATLVLSALLSACKEDGEAPPAKPPRLSVEELKDPETCKSCHPTHYREWKASMHAYAADDPVFIAMNELGQRETNGELGNFCVNCHAPMAVREGKVDGGILDEDTPQHMKGVTCYFCHNVESVSGEHNAEVTLANDDIMRGTILNPIEPSAHGVRFSNLLESENPKSNTFCGGCHDIALENGVHLERTFAEYQATIFSDTSVAGGFQSCGTCHMPKREGGLAAVDDGLPGDDERIASRPVSSHLWPGVDVAMTSWPDREPYEAAVACALDNSITIYRDGTGQGEPDEIVYSIETGAGHNMPSGASQDRRLWIEMIAYKGDTVVCSRGAVPDDEVVSEFRDRNACPTPGTEPFPLFRDRIFDETGAETHMFWRAAPSDAVESGVISNLMPGPTGFNPDGSVARHTEVATYGPFIGYDIDRITVRLKMRPIDYDVLDELIAEGTLAEEVRDEVRTFTISSASVDYMLEGGMWVATPAPPRKDDCACAFDPTLPNCD